MIRCVFEKAAPLRPALLCGRQRRISNTGTRRYLFPVKALSRHFRATMVSALRRARQDGGLSRMEAAQVTAQFDELKQHEWVVAYVSRNTHKFAISDHRIDAVDENQVRFSYQDYRDG